MFDHEPTLEELREYLGKVPGREGVNLVDYLSFVIPLKQRKNVGTQDQKVYKDFWQPYMSVDGRLAMAWADHQKQAKRLDIVTEVAWNGDGVGARATVNSEVYGTATGYAEGERESAGVNKTNPAENAETSAVGRALGNLGYGLLPGAGVASAEEVQNARERQAAPPKQSAKQAVPAPAPTQEPGEEFCCPQCGETMQEKSGTSNKTSKPWRGLFCPDKNCKHVEWLPVSAGNGETDPKERS